MSESQRVARRPIRVLPPALASRIAAGEVIERPASVVKELIENAIDAAARSIRLEITEAGFGRIQVIDDGIGIPPDELPLACERHATSKLLDDDLRRIRTLGFRGEALPSIAAVAELTLLSATAESRIGRRLTLRDNKIVRDEPVAHPPGTTVIVKHLFANVPVRLAAAKQKHVEAAQIVQAVRRLALAAPHVRFSVLLDGRHVLQTSGSGDLVMVMSEVYGLPPESLQSIETVEAAEVKITGVIADPSITRPGRSHLHILVNERWTQPRGVLNAIEAAYRPLLPRGRHPLLTLALTVPPEHVDVNIHPAKLEVRLHHESQIGKIAAELIRNTLGRKARTFQLAAAAVTDPLVSSTQVAEDQPPYDNRLVVTPNLPPLHILGQVQHRLILAEGPDGLYLIDQHRAHERVLYERLKAATHDAPDTLVELAEPMILELTPSQAIKLSKWLDAFVALGFHCETFGRHTFLLRTTPYLPGIVTGTRHAGEFPAVGQRDALIPALLEALDDAAEEDSESWRERLCIRLACRTAVRRGRPLDLPGLCALVQALGETPTPAVCPHGSPTLLRIDGQALARQFDWL